MTETPATPPRALTTWAEPRSLADARQVAEAVARSGLAPQSARSPDAVMVILATGAELGLPPMAALRSIHVVSGRAVLSADLMRALVMRAGGDLWCVEASPTRAEWRARRNGRESAAVWTIEMARRAGLAGKTGPWQQYPHAMLSARASVEICRRVWPEVCAGLYTPDEMGASEAVEVEVVPAPTSDTPPQPAEVVEAEVVPETPPEPPPPAETSRRPPLSAHLARLVAYARRQGIDLEAVTDAAGALGCESPRDLTPDQALAIEARWADGGAR